jgi:hypothetical protein
MRNLKDWESGSDKLSVDGELLTRGEIGDQPLTYQNLRERFGFGGTNISVRGFIS